MTEKDYIEDLVRGKGGLKWYSYWTGGIKLINKESVKEAKKLIVEFNKFIKKKGLRLNFNNTLTLAEYLLQINNNYRTVDKAIISYRKV